MNYFILTVIGFMVVGIVLSKQISGSNGESELTPPCHFKICGVAEMPDSIPEDVEYSDSAKLSENNPTDSFYVNSEIENTIVQKEESVDKEETTNSENLVSGINPSKKMCLFKLCLTEPVMKVYRM